MTIENILKKYINDKYSYEKLISYFSRHEVIGEEIFPYLGDSYAKLSENIDYQPITKESFIKRIPFYFYKPDRNVKNVGNLNQYISGIFRETSQFTDTEVWIERLYQILEKLFYHYKLDLETIFEYPIRQTGFACRTDFLFQWFHYLEICEKLELTVQTPQHFIVEYNKALEKGGLPPIIYEINEQFNYEYISRSGNIFELQGTFPCENGQPILKWIGVKIYDPIKVWSKVDNRLKGSIFVEAGPTTSIWGLNCWGTHDDGSDQWYMLYAGPQLMEFDSEALKNLRKREKLSQQQVANAIGASVRTYQKWESGETTPDSHHLLRLMNILDIRDTQEITRWPVPDEL